MKKIIETMFSGPSLGSVRGPLKPVHPVIRLEIQKCMELSTEELIKVLIYRAAKTNGMSFVSSRLLTRLVGIVIHALAAKGSKS
jgi:hypothetical protein